MVSLKGMDVGALLRLRDQVDERLVELRAELEKQLAAFTGQAMLRGKSLKGRKVPPKYRSRSGETWAGRGARTMWQTGGGGLCETLGQWGQKFCSRTVSCRILKSLQLSPE